MAGFKRFRNLVEQEPDIEDAPQAKGVQNLKGDIKFHNVDFSYDRYKTVLENINLNIHTGETVAFVGPSGAGKSTICSLIPRFYDVNNGSITIDGIDIKGMTKSLRQQIGIVQQDVFLFTGTVRENIAYGKQDATEHEIREAARKAHLDDVIANLPQGYDTQIGERGLKLSGGQNKGLRLRGCFKKSSNSYFR